MLMAARQHLGFLGVLYVSMIDVLLFCITIINISKGLLIKWSFIDYKVTKIKKVFDTYKVFQTYRR